jgi:predicted Zn-dependent protease
MESAAERMQVLVDKYGVDRSLLASWFGSHPNTQNRVLQLKDMAEDLPAGRTPSEKEPMPAKIGGER